MDAVVAELLRQQAELVFQHRLGEEVVVVVEAIGAKRVGCEVLRAGDDVGGGRGEVRLAEPAGEVGARAVANRPDRVEPLHARVARVERAIVLVDDVDAGAEDGLLRVLLEPRQAFLEAVEHVVVVGVEDADEVAVRGGQGDAAADGRVRAGVGLRAELDLAARRVALEDLHRAVRGAVVDDDDALGRARLAEAGIDRLLDVLLVVVAGDDDG